jgi:small nuclear ribonucleoprotein (snRNP)-like protein
LHAELFPVGELTGEISGIDQHYNLSLPFVVRQNLDQDKSYVDALRKHSFQRSPSYGHAYHEMLEVTVFIELKEF